MYPGILGTWSDPFQEVLPAVNVVFGPGSALHGLQDCWEAPVRQSRTQTFSPQSQWGIRTEHRFRWGIGFRVGNKCVLFGKPAGSWAFHQLQSAGKVMMGLKRLLCRRLVMSSTKCSIKIRDFSGISGNGSVARRRNTLLCRHGGSGLVETFRSVIKSCLLWAGQARSVLSVLFCGGHSSSNFRGLVGCYFSFCLSGIASTLISFCTQTNWKPLDALM